MKIVLISPQFISKSNHGGVAISYYRFAKILTALNHEVHVITKGDNTIGFEQILFKNSSIKIHYVNLNFVTRMISLFLNKINTHLSEIIIWNILSFFLFKNTNKKNKFDIIFSPPYKTPALLIKLLNKNIHHIITDHGNPVEFSNYDINKKRGLISNLENYYLKNFSNQIVSCSNYEKKISEKHIKGYKNSNTVINNTLPKEYTFYKNIKEIDKTNIVFVGTFSYRKGADIAVKSFIRIARKNKKINIYFIGNDLISFQKNGTKINFKLYINHLKLPLNITNRIHFIPHIKNYNSTIQLLKNLKGIMVVPSRYEPFGMVIIEAMVMGYITIASKESIASEIITHKHNGLLIKPTISDTVQKIELVLKMKNDDLKKISNNATTKVKTKFNMLSQKNKFKKILMNYKK